MFVILVLWPMCDVARVCIFCRLFVDQCFRPFSASLADEGVYKALCWESTSYTKSVNEAMDRCVKCHSVIDSVSKLLLSAILITHLRSCCEITVVIDI